MKVSFATEQRRTTQTFGLIPTCTSSQADQGDGMGVVVGGLPALIEQHTDLIEAQKSQLGLVGLDLADFGQRVDAMSCAEAD